MKKKLLLILLIACILFSVSFVSASDINDTAVASDESDLNNLEVISDNENPILTEEIQDSSDDGTYTALQTKISNAEEGGTINLTRNYQYNDDIELNN